MSESFSIRNHDAWAAKVVPSVAPATRRGRRRSGVSEVPIVPARFLLPDVRIEAAREVTPAPARRGSPAPTIEIDVRTAHDERSLIAVRHASGALTFHPPGLRIPIAGARRRSTSHGATGNVTDRYSIEVPSAATAARRGLVTKLLKIAVLKILQPAIDAARDTAIGLAASGGEMVFWKLRGLARGWHRVRTNGQQLALTAASPADIGRSERALLLLHGTFSHAAGAFAGMASSGFLAEARAIYGDRIFAFNHFTISDTPEDNVRDLLQTIPADGREFDAITHSRGGLVLRHAVERGDLFGSLADRFRLGHAVLVASPNAGTPLATPDRYQETFGFFANLLELLPDNPWTTLPELVSNGIVWLASNTVPALKGLASMDGNGPIITALQEAPSALSAGYSALCANYEPGGGVLARLLDSGIDHFFQGANDLVVPTEGGWLVDNSTRSVPAERVGCFGPGGNLTSSSGTAVTHVNFFGLAETRDFLLRALRGQAQGLRPIDLDAALPARRARRGGVRPGLPSPPPAPTPARGHAPEPSGRASGMEFGIGAQDAALPRGIDGNGRFFGDDVLQLMILGRGVGGDAPQLRDIQILAMYGSARAIEWFPTRNDATEVGDAPALARRTTRASSGGRVAKAADAGNDGEAGSRFRRIIDTHRQIRMRIAGEAEKTSSRVPDFPDDDRLRRFGEDLFRNLFVGGVQRLYDVARSEQRDRPLNLIFTCEVPWLAALPWEFAFDPTRLKFLVTEEIHFIRNVLTTVPAQAVDTRDKALRILVVVAQPQGTQELASDEEETRIHTGFRRLIDAGLVEVTVLTDVTPDRLHRMVEGAARERRPFDVVHFIGHGEFDSKANAGTLIFTDATGLPQEVSIRALREILGNRGIGLVFLNACDTARDDRSSLNRGVAQALVEAGLPAVVANQYPVLDPSAVAFAEHFYWSLGTGGTLGEAVREARIALNYSIDGETIDWAVPVLYARDPNYRLCRPRAVRHEPPRMRTAVVPTQVPPMPSVAPTRRRPRSVKAQPVTAGPRTLRVGVADFTRFFSGLDALLARLNLAQSRIEFRVVDLIVPIGVWRQSKQIASDDDAPVRSYLDANAFARRLKSKPAELKVDLLIGATDQWMMHEENGEMHYDSYGWWSEVPDENIVLLSIAGFPVRRTGSSTDRPLTNALVASIAGKLFEEASRKPAIHETGPRTCPFFYNPERDFELMAARQVFDARCRKRLEKQLPRSLEPASLVQAFEALLELDPG